MKRSILIIALLASGCATTYQENGFSGGYSDQKISNDVFQVSFRGNGFTSGSEVERLFLKRCADVSMRNGFDYFVILNQDGSVSDVPVYSSQQGTISSNGFGGYNYSGTSQTSSVSKHRKSGLIKLFKNGDQPQNALNAREVFQNIN